MNPGCLPLANAASEAASGCPPLQDGKHSYSPATSPVAAFDLSVVIPTFDRRASVLRLLAALAEQTHPPTRFEVIVVDDGSSDGTVEALRTLSVPYALRVLTQSHAGPAQARNLGVQHAQASLIIFLDDDVVPDRELLGTHIRAHENAPDLVLIGPMMPPNGWPRPAWVRWEEEKLLRQYQALARGAYACTPRQFFTANVSLARWRFLEAGGFDPSFRRAEDVELGYRLRDQGATFVFAPHAIVTHYPSRSFEAWCRTPYQYGCYDVVMHREKGHDSLRAALQEFHRRHIFSRLLTRLCVGKSRRLRATVWALGTTVHLADRFGASRQAIFALSGIFNLLYWQGVSDELGSAQALWQALLGRSKA